MKIVFNGYFYKNEKLKVDKAVKIFSQTFKISKNFHFTVHSLNESESKELNHKTFNKNKPTDVLSFPLYNDIDSINKLDKRRKRGNSTVFWEDFKKRINN